MHSICVPFTLEESSVLLLYASNDSMPGRKQVMRIHYVVIVVCFDLTVTTHAASADNWIFGPGLLACSDWLEKTKSNNGGAGVTYGWISGFWSGIDTAAGKEVGKGAGVSSVLSEMLTYCQTYPSEILSSAVQRVYIRLDNEGK
jgi:hypothetical protein